jgi:hypothetical protein
MQQKGGSKNSIGKFGARNAENLSFIAENRMRTKELSTSRSVASRQGNFTFRRIHGRELYEPVSTETVRFSFRLRLNQSQRRTS